MENKCFNTALPEFDKNNYKDLMNIIHFNNKPGFIIQDDIIDKSGNKIKFVFDLQEIDRLRKVEPETKLNLVRGDTVPDDIREIYAADGILTSRGGVSSHAAVVAHRLEKTCVVGCGNLVCNEKEKKCVFDDIVLTSGDFISIDRREGSVYRDLIQVKETV